MLLRELTETARRLALVGLAKNTGKTVTLTVLLRELAAAGRTVGVTSVGRDGEEHDAIDARIDKPRVHLQAGAIGARPSRPGLGGLGLGLRRCDRRARNQRHPDSNQDQDRDHDHRDGLGEMDAER